MEKRKPLLSLFVWLMAVLLSATTAVAQSLTITGVVTDASQDPVIGASVLVQGTTNGTITDVDGKFQLSNVSAKGTLLISYIGYKSQALPVNGKTTFTVVLAEDTETLDEVVVVGYGVQKKVNLTGAVASVKGDALERRRETAQPLVDALHDRAVGARRFQTARV